MHSSRSPAGTVGNEGPMSCETRTNIDRPADLLDRSPVFAVNVYDDGHLTDFPDPSGKRTAEKTRRLLSSQKATKEQ